MKSATVGALKHLLFTLFLGITISPAALSVDLDLTTAIQRTLQAHPNFQVFSIKRNQLLGLQHTANLKPPLNINVEIENFSGSGEYQSFDQLELSLALSSVIEMGQQRMHRLSAVNARQQKLKIEQQIIALELMGDTTRHFVTLLSVQEMAQLAVEAEVLASSVLQSVQRRVEAGASPRADELRAQAVLAEAKSAIAQAEADVVIQKRRLIAMWAGNDIDFDQAEGDLLLLPEPLSESVLEQRFNQNPQVEIYAQEEFLKQVEIRAAKSNSSMDLGWQVGVRQFTLENDTAFVAGISLPLFNKSRNSGEVLVAEANLSETQLKQRANRRQLRNDLLSHYTQFKTKRDHVNNLKENIIPLLQQALVDAQQSFQRGLYGYMELVAARQELLQAQKNLIETATQALILQADIEQLTAEPLPIPLLTNEARQ